MSWTIYIYIEYGEELLFRNMAGIIKTLSDNYDCHLDEANAWYNAKLVVHTLRDVNRPELLIERAATALVQGQMYYEYEGSQIILLCAYAMICSDRDNTHFAPFIKKMESLAYADTDLSVIKRHIERLKKWTSEAPVPYDDYDYIGEQSTQNDHFTSADIERIKNYIIEKEKKERETLLKKVEELEGKLNEKTIEIKRLEYEYSELERSLKNDNTETLSEEEQLGIDERIIFYSSVLKIDSYANETNHTQLAKFISKQTGCKPESVRSRIGKIFAMQNNNSYTDEVIQAARNVIDSLSNCFKKTILSEKANLNDATSDIIDDIEKVFDLSKR